MSVVRVLARSKITVILAVSRCVECFSMIHGNEYKTRVKPWRDVQGYRLTQSLCKTADLRIN